MIFIIVMISVAVALLPHLIYIIAKMVSLVGGFKVAYKPYGYAALTLVGVWLLLFCWGHWFGRYFHEVKNVEVECKGLPGQFDGYRIVHISDLHLDGWVGKTDKLQEIVDEINAQNPDLICFTGDLVSLSKDELTPAVAVLKEMKAKDGVIAIMGNHDYMPYDRTMTEKERWSGVAELQRMEREGLGWTLLLNQHSVIRRGNDSIAVIGCENQSMGVHSIIQRGNLKQAAEGTKGMFPVVLTHDPTHWRGEVLGFMKDRDGSLTLSGHTHSGQFRVFGFSVARFVYDEYDGIYTEGSHNLYVNIGLGGTMPMRVGATPEVTVLTLRSAK